MNIFDMRTMILCHRNEKKNKSKVCFVESSFGQKVWSTFPGAQYQNGEGNTINKSISISL